jgi:hypothetical protein
VSADTVWQNKLSRVTFIVPLMYLDFVRGASCTPSGKGQGSVVAVYLIKVPGDAELP